MRCRNTFIWYEKRTMICDLPKYALGETCAKKHVQKGIKQNLDIHVLYYNQSGSTYCKKLYFAFKDAGALASDGHPVKSKFFLTSQNRKSAEHRWSLRILNSSGGRGPHTVLPSWFSTVCRKSPEYFSRSEPNADQMQFTSLIFHLQWLV